MSEEGSGREQNTQLEGGVTGHVVTASGQEQTLHPRITKETPKAGKDQGR